MSENNDIITAPISSAEIEQIENIELFFFAYRDFIADPDRILANYDFGRAHHRALYFVNRNPGMTVAELIDILKITKQSLSRVLKELVQSEYISQSTGKTDRRKRLLYPTTKGRELILALSSPQSQRISNAMAGLDPETQKQVSRFLKSMLDEYM